MRRYASKIPPQVLASLENMRESDRKIRASELLGSYEAKADKLEKVGTRMALDWVKSQGKFLEVVCEELEGIILTGDLPERIKGGI